MSGPGQVPEFVAILSHPSGVSLVFLIPIIAVATLALVAGVLVLWLAHNAFSPLGRGGLPR
jgi:hypothetical protein